MSVKTVDIHEAQRQLIELLSLVHTGTEVILTEDNVPRARLVALPKGSGAVRVAGLHTGRIRASEDFDAPLPDEFWSGTA